MNIIELSDITKSFPDGNNRLNKVLRGIDMQIKSGEFVAVKGASGSGKTTLLSILGTLMLPDSGSYLLNGNEMTTPGTDHSGVRNRQIGFVFQDHRLMPQLTVMENMLLPILAYNAKTTAAEADYARNLLELTNIPGIEKQYPITLSGGEASRVAVCRALIMKPLLLLADEPTGQLDAENARNIANLLVEINKNLLTTIIMVTHSDETSAKAHRVLKLKEGIIQ